MIKMKLADERCLPKIGSTQAAGMDLRAFFGTRPADDLRGIKPGQTLEIDTGVYMQIPEGWCGMVLPRSSIGNLRCKLANTVGLIDSDYRGRILLKVYNYGNELVTLENFQRICQIVIVPHYPTTHFEIVDELDSTERGEGGFGHSGTQ